MSVELVDDATEDVKAEILLDEDDTEAVEHEQVPRERESEEDEESTEEGSADAEGGQEGSAGSGLAHEGDSEAGPIELPAGVGRGSFSE